MGMHDLGLALPGPWKQSDDYMTECSLSILQDLISAWNFHCVGCCVWHAQVDRLASLVRRLRTFHCCEDRWKPPNIEWQCQICTALHSATSAQDLCWLCMTPSSDAEESAGECTIDTA